MSSLQCFRDFITERLTFAAEEIFRHVERTVVEYEEELDRQRKLLEFVRKPRLLRIELPKQHVCKEGEVLTEQQLCKEERNSSLDQKLRCYELPQQHVFEEKEVTCNQEGNSTLDQEKPESLQVKEEQEETCTSHDGEQLEVKQEADTLMMTPAGQNQNQTGSHHVEKNTIEHEEDVDLQHRLCMKWGPVIKLHRTELPQQHVCKEGEVLTVQKLWNQERKSSLDQEEPESLQSKEEQEADRLILTPDIEESDHMEPEPDSDHQLLSHSSPVAQRREQTGSHHLDCVSNGSAESEPCKKRKRNEVENCHASKTESETHTDSHQIFSEAQSVLNFVDQQCIFCSLDVEATTGHLLQKHLTEAMYFVDGDTEKFVMSCYCKEAKPTPIRISHYHCPLCNYRVLSHTKAFKKHLQECHGLESFKKKGVHFSQDRFIY